MKKQPIKNEKPTVTSAERIKRRNKWLEVTAWLLATVVLVFALVYFNFIAKEPEYVVYAEGDTCPNFTISTYNNEEETYTLHDSAGKVIVLNFWYTTCGPCVAEIPHFNALQEKYPDDIDVLIIHRVDPAEGEVIKKIEDMGWTDYKAIFAQDDKVFELGTVSLYHGLGGPISNPYPITVILDGKFRISKVRIGGMPADELEEAVLAAMNK
jgi:thiol-disulfide isomerase/thioredoxin